MHLILIELHNSTLILGVGNLLVFILFFYCLRSHFRWSCGLVSFNNNIYGYKQEAFDHSWYFFKRSAAVALPENQSVVT